MNIFIRELRANFKSLLIWGFIVVLFNTVGFMKFAAYYENPDLLVVLDRMPQALLDAFNFRAFNLTTITGFFGIMFTYFALILSISAAMWGSDIITKEERDKTIEFSLTLPVSRSKLITAKILAAFVNCLGLLFITWAITLLNVSKYQPESEFYGFFYRSLLALFIMQMIFLAIGIFLGCAMKRYKLAASVALGILLGTYFISIVTDLNENLEFLKYFSPFKYFNAAALFHEAKIDPVYLWLSAIIVLVSLVGAYFTYSKRDLYI